MIVGEVRLSERVTIVSAGCIRTGGHSNAVHIGAYKYGLRQHPASGGLVILGDGIAIVPGFAWSSEARPQGIARLGKSSGERAGGLIEYCEIQVNPLHELSRTNGAVGVGRRAAIAIRGSDAHSHAENVEACCG